jgi:hypothetical protein
MIFLVLKNLEPEAAMVRGYAELLDAALLLINAADEPIEILGNSKLALSEDLHTLNSPRTPNDERSDDD